MDTQKSNVFDLPIMKHFEGGEVNLNNVSKKLKGGQKGLFIFLSLLAVGAVAYFSWTYVIPPLFKLLGQVIALAITGAVIVFLFLIAPAVFKFLKFTAIRLHKALIASDPFAELALQKQKMIRNRENFRNSKTKLKGLKNEMEILASKSEKEAKDYQEQVLSLQRQSETLKTQMDEQVRQHGLEAKDTDEYVALQSTLAKKLSESQRVAVQYEQSRSFIQKYGVRANVLGKMDRKLTLAGTAIDIKISDFETTISMLQKEYEFAKNSRAATESAKDAMLFTKDWELDYALDVVTSTIAEDIARTSENLLDIDTLTSKYSVDNDELYTRLDSLADKIKTGDSTIPDSTKYRSENYKMTKEDKQNSAGFGDIF